MKVMALRPAGEIIVQLPSGKGALFRPARLAGNRVEDAVRVFDVHDLTLHVGDPIRWTANDRVRSLANAETARLEAVGADGLLFRTAEGKAVQLGRDDPMLKRIDLAYAANAHASQGATADNAIVVAQSTEGALINRSLVGALFTRSRESMTFVVDKLTSFERRARMNAGEKQSAIEIAGNDVKGRGVPTPENPARHPQPQSEKPAPTPGERGPRWPLPPPAVEQTRLPIPERQMDLGL
jgi:hypothetical protein